MAKADTSGTLGIFIPDIDNKKLTARLAELQDFVKGILVGPTQENPLGVDYGPAYKGGTKDVLLLPGAQKLAAIWGILGNPEITHRFENWAAQLEGTWAPLLDYESTTRFEYRSDGRKAATGIGAANSYESKWLYTNNWFNGVKTKVVNKDLAGQKNTIIKICLKRGYVPGVLYETALSGLFTQDIETGDEQGWSDPPPGQYEQMQQHQRDLNGIIHTPQHFLPPQQIFNAPADMQSALPQAVQANGGTGAPEPPKQAVPSAETQIQSTPPQTSQSAPSAAPSNSALQAPPPGNSSSGASPTGQAPPPPVQAPAEPTVVQVPSSDGPPPKEAMGLILEKAQASGWSREATNIKTMELLTSYGVDTTSLPNVLKTWTADHVRQCMEYFQNNKPS